MISQTMHWPSNQLTLCTVMMHVKAMGMSIEKVEEGFAQLKMPITNA